MTSQGPREVAERVYVVPPNQFGSSNCGFVAGADETLVVDTRMAPMLGRQLFDGIRAVTGSPVTTVVNTHFHGDHVFGNEVFGPDVAVVSHRLAREEILERGDAMVEEFLDHYNIAARYPADVVADIRSVQVRTATVVFDEGYTHKVGDLTVELDYVGPAHSKGDIVAYLPDAGVLFAGDLVFQDIHPYWLDGYLPGTIASLRRLVDWPIEVVVPGHGPVTDRTALAEMLRYFETIEAVLHQAVAAGSGGADALHSLEATLGDYGAQPQRLASTVHRFWTQMTASGLEERA
ncbi:MBL fold metallo-hydrolase [Nocardioides sp. KR10-350]|uniref:MBL fold metallo-hydrolase n=1 Tax=Nocardioides cheoyonin TaxID=3156615 RepID=UPI0032B610EC